MAAQPVRVGLRVQPQNSAAPIPTRSPCWSRSPTCWPHTPFRPCLCGLQPPPPPASYVCCPLCSCLRPLPALCALPRTVSHILLLPPLNNQVLFKGALFAGPCPGASSQRAWVDSWPRHPRPRSFRPCRAQSHLFTGQGHQVAGTLSAPRAGTDLATRSPGDTAKRSPWSLWLWMHEGRGIQFTDALQG